MGLLLVVSTIVIFLLTIIVIGVNFLSERTSEIRDVRVTNITGTSATVTWISDSPTCGSVIYAKEDKWFPIFRYIGKDRAYDERDIEEVEYGVYKINQWREYYVHYVILRELNPNSKYYYKVSTGMRSVDYEYPPLETIDIADELKSPYPVYGRVFNSKRESLDEGIVLLSLKSIETDDSNIHEKQSQVASTLINTESGWSIDIGLLRQENLEEFFDINSDFIVDLEIITSNEWTQVRNIPSEKLQPLGDIYTEPYSPIELEKSNSSLINQIYAADCGGLSGWHCTNDTCIAYYCNPDLGDWDWGNPKSCDSICKPQPCWNSKCVGTTTTVPPSTPATPGTTQYISDEDWGGAGLYCYDNDLYYCSNKTTCSKNLECNESGCEKMPVGKNDRCFSGGTPSVTSDQKIPDDKWKGEGLYCYDNDVYACLTKSNCKIYTDCGDAGCREISDFGPGQYGICNNIADVGGPTTKGDGVVTISSDDWGGVGLYCYGNNLYYCTKSDDCTLNQECGSYGCTKMPTGRNDKCAVGQEQSDVEDRVNENMSCDVGRDHWESVSSYHDLLERYVPEGISVHGSRKFEENDVTYLALCSIRQINNNYEAFWEVSILDTKRDITCNELGIEGHPEGSFIELGSGDIYICLNGTVHIVDTYPHEYRSACNGSLSDSNNIVQNGQHWFNCSKEAFLAGSYHSLVEIVQYDNDCVPVHNQPDCRPDCIALFGVCDKSHGEPCEWRQASGVYFNNCRYGLECLSGSCVNPRLDSDGDGINDINDADPDDPCFPIASGDDCPPITNVGLAPIDLEITYYDISSGDRTSLVGEHVSNNYDQDLLSTYNYNSSNNTSNKDAVWIHQTGDDVTGLNIATYWRDNVIDPDGNLIPYAHVVIDRNGVITQVTNIEQVALHAGEQEGNIRGIAIENVGQSGSDFSQEQIDSMVDLIETWEVSGFIHDKCSVIGHSERTLTGPGGEYHNPDPGDTNMEMLKDALGCTSSDGYKYVDDTNKGLIRKVEAEVAEERKMEITSDIVKLSGNSIIYWDWNNNGEMDPMETEVKISSLEKVKISNGVFINLDVGWNIISIPNYTKIEEGSNVGDAKSLLENINDQGVYATHVATYFGGRWYVYSQRNGISFSNNFSIIPGQGYFIKVYNAGKVMFKGAEIEESLPIEFERGWNLVSIVSPETEYTSDSLLDAINGDGIKADTITRWDNGRYENFIKENDIPYGNDFKIFEVGGYFIRVRDNGGRFVP
ncbi:N-acetylmuramoyl-L-alanine amidase [Candidatus Dojkabacteria bacterium]|nr:N-acetylmuramoyl-L-alanine amidase [Candidatus Dojkabacteria bacterium]